MFKERSFWQKNKVAAPTQDIESVNTFLKTEILYSFPQNRAISPRHADSFKVNSLHAAEYIVAHPSSWRLIEWAKEAVEMAQKLVFSNKYQSKLISKEGLRFLLGMDKHIEEILDLMETTKVYSITERQWLLHTNFRLEEIEDIFRTFVISQKIKKIVSYTDVSKREFLQWVWLQKNKWTDITSFNSDSLYKESFQVIDVDIIIRLQKQIRTDLKGLQPKDIISEDQYRELLGMEKFSFLSPVDGGVHLSAGTTYDGELPPL
jgi:hypothetical protein